MMYRAGIVLIAVAAGIGAGALVFKVVGSERIGAEVNTFAARFGVKPSGGQDGFALIERLAPGTEAAITGAVVGTVVASLLAATAVTIAIREVAGS